MLEFTEQILKQKAEFEYFDTYALMISVNGVKESVFSGNANADTLFDIASMGKVLVTSTLVLKAVGEGLLGLDDTIAKYYPNARGDRRDITVRQLLTHTSGMVTNSGAIGPLYEVGADCVAYQILVQKLRFAPGTDCRYCSTGMTLLGFILEKIYGMPLERIFIKYIAEPLGYTRSCFNMPAGEPNSAVSYSRAELGDYSSPWDDADNCAYRTSQGSGGQFFTVNDISKFCEAVLNKSETLYPEYLYAMAEKPYAQCRDNEKELRGLGWYIYGDRSVTGGKLVPKGSFGHNGHTGTRFFINREKNMYGILLTNATRFLARRHGFKGFDSAENYPLWQDIFNAVFRDLSDEGVL